MQKKTFGFIGSGRVSYLLLSRLQQQSALPEKVWVSDPDENALKKVTGLAPKRIEAVNENRVAAAADVVFLAVHPPVMKEVAAEIKNTLKAEALLISFLPTVGILRLAEFLGGFDRIVRMIPNAPSIIGGGYNPVCYSQTLPAGDRSFLQTLFQLWGETPEVPEEQLEAYAILTGMGPTYFWFQWLELQRLAQEFGLEEPVAKQALSEMLHGSVDTLFKTDLSFEQTLDLIPSYPLKKNEDEIRQIISKRLGGLWQKLKEATK
ncbi:MAG: NAD(P)-binding domain-containing protein [Syntrophaceae bacterium]|nr:NAD(P)-binding domain-containing protein [Syntrophaceae bacterium]